MSSSHDSKQLDVVLLAILIILGAIGCHGRELERKEKTIQYLQSMIDDYDRSFLISKSSVVDHYEYLLDYVQNNPDPDLRRPIPISAVLSWGYAAENMHYLNLRCYWLQDVPKIQGFVLEQDGHEIAKAIPRKTKRSMSEWKEVVENDGWTVSYIWDYAVDVMLEPLPDEGVPKGLIKNQEQIIYLDVSTLIEPIFLRIITEDGTTEQVEVALEYDVPTPTSDAVSYAREHGFELEWGLFRAIYRQGDRAAFGVWDYARSQSLNKFEFLSSSFTRWDDGESISLDQQEEIRRRVFKYLALTGKDARMQAEAESTRQD